VFNIINHEENANQSRNKTDTTAYPIGQLSQSKTDEAVERLETSNETFG
jgi:hypothetical protein